MSTPQLDLVSGVKTPRDIPKVTDIDWAASDKPVMACVDGCVRVMDIKFLTGASSLADRQLCGRWT